MCTFVSLQDTQCFMVNVATSHPIPCLNKTTVSIGNKGKAFDHFVDIGVLRCSCFQKKMKLRNDA